MFKKNPLRPPIIVELKRLPNGYRVHPSQATSLFQFKRVTRTMYRPDLIQASNMGMESQGLGISSTIIQPPSHVTLPAFAGWFRLDSVHPIEREFFPQFFHADVSEECFSFAIKNSRLYSYYRNTIIGMWRQNVKKYLSSAHCRRNLVGDVSSIIRIHGFLQNWGLINFPSKDHSKGVIAQKAQRLSCYVCEDAQSQIFHIAAVEDVLFQLCDSCFQQGLYSQQMDAKDFIQILSKEYKHPQNKIMNASQIIKMLELLTVAAGPVRDRDKQAWTLVQKQFPQFSREDLVYNFLRIPLAYQMNANIFENNEDVLEEKGLNNNEHQPSILQDFQNPLQASIAVSFYRWKQQKSGQSKLQSLFGAAELQSRILAEQQAQKIDQVVKMMVEVSYSKLQHKSLFIYQYEKLIQRSNESQKKIIMSTLAESLKQNVRLIQSQEEPQQLYRQQQNNQNQALFS